MKTKICLIGLLFAALFSIQAQQSGMDSLTLDLRDANFDGKDVRTLNTKWRFVYGDFVPPSHIISRKNEIQLSVPSMWGGTPSELGPLPNQGYATYYLRVLLPNTQKPLGLKVPEMSSAYRLFINGKMVAQAGRVAKTPIESIPETKPLVVELPDVGRVAHIVFHISNFHHKKSGLWDTIHIGGYHTMVAKENRNYFFAIFLSGAILIIGLYHIGLFFLRPKDKAPLYFSLFALATVIRLMSTGEMLILDLFPSLSWEWRLTLDHISMYLALGFGVMFSHYLFPQEIKKWPALTSIGLAMLFSFAAIFTSGLTNSYFVFYYQIIILISLAFLCVAIYFTVKRKRQGAIAYAFGYLMVMLSATNDVLYSLNIIPTYYILPIGVFLFFFSQAFVLSIRSAKAFIKSEKLGKQLQNINQELEQKVKERTAVIAAKNDELQQINYHLQERESELEEKAADLEKLNKQLQETQNKVADTLKKEIQVNKELEHALKQLKDTQGHLIQSEKMASLGQLTAGIAHEINNPINFVSAGVDCLQPLIVDLLAVLAHYEMLDNSQEDDFEDLLIKIRKLKSELELDIVKQELVQSLKDVQIGVDRTIEIVNGLRDFSHGGNSQERISADIHQCIDSCLLMLKTKYKHRIEIELDFDENVPSIICRVGQIHQVLLNLISNAIQAIEGEGHIKIKTQRLENDFIKITVADSGKGIPKQVMQKIFDPFFTTKDVGEGTGLGLSIAHGIIQGHGGAISVTTEESKGTEFYITLPIFGVSLEEEAA